MASILFGKKSADTPNSETGACSPVRKHLDIAFELGIAWARKNPLSCAKVIVSLDDGKAYSARVNTTARGNLSHGSEQELFKIGKVLHAQNNPAYLISIASDADRKAFNTNSAASSGVSEMNKDERASN